MDILITFNTSPDKAEPSEKILLSAFEFGTLLENTIRQFKAREDCEWLTTTGFAFKNRAITLCAGGCRHLVEFRVVPMGVRVE